MKDLWIVGLSVGHNASMCLLKNGEIVCYIEEERLSRIKHDDLPFLALRKVLEYTDKIDYLVTSVVDYLPAYEGYARKLGLIEDSSQVLTDIPHHMCHAASAFYTSGFSEAACVVIDAAGNEVKIDDTDFFGMEIESIFYANYPCDFKIIHKRLGNNLSKATIEAEHHQFVSEPGIGAIYSGLSVALGYGNLDCGKVMGLASYGKHDKSIPSIYIKYKGLSGDVEKVNDEIVLSGQQIYWIADFVDVNKYDRSNLSYAVQKATQEKALSIIQRALSETGSKNLVLSGGYFLNCVANYEFLKHLPDDVKIHVDPAAYDGGISIGLAKLCHHKFTQDTTKRPQQSYFLGPKPKYHYTLKENETECNTSVSDIIDLIIDGKIIALFQGSSEAGPRALGHRSLIFDPRVENGKDIVNSVKRREFFRPFAGTILEEYANEWFDLRSLKSSPFMMYAVNVLEDKKDLIPSIVHVDGTCRIQTLNRTQDKNYYDLIYNFYEKTGVPVLFDTSFNLGGDPLVETIEDALETLRRSDLEYLYLPEINKLIKIKENNNVN